MGCYAEPLIFGRTVEKLGLGSGILWVMANWCCISCFISRTLIRGKVRALNRIPGSGCGGEYLFRSEFSGLGHNFEHYFRLLHRFLVYSMYSLSRISPSWLNGRCLPSLGSSSEPNPTTDGHSSTSRRKSTCHHSTHNSSIIRSVGRS